MVVAQQHFQEMQPWSNRLSGNTSKTIFAHSSWARYIINSGHGNWNTSKEKQALKRLEVKTTHHVNWRAVTTSQAICAQKSTDVLSIAKLHSSKLFQRMKKKKKHNIANVLTMCLIMGLKGWLFRALKYLNTREIILYYFTLFFFLCDNDWQWFQV